MTAAVTTSSLLDIKTAAFDRLPSTFGGEAIRGDGTDEDVLRRAGAEGADVFLALTEGDNRNVMAAQLANEALGIERVIAKINDPLRGEGVCRARHRDALPDRPDVGRRSIVPRPAAVGAARDACPDGAPRHARARSTATHRVAAAGAIPPAAGQSAAPTATKEA